MEQKIVRVRLAFQCGLKPLSLPGRFILQVRWSAICCGLAGALLVGERAAAQVPQGEKPGSRRLTVRPHEIATGAQNPQAGEYPLGSVPGFLVYVPTKCAGTQRCPLVVFLPKDGDGAREVTNSLRPVADKYGVILLASSKKYQPSVLDTALKEVLQKFAIDPDKIGIFGRDASGEPAMRFGIDNADVFNRTGSISSRFTIDNTLDTIDPQNKTTELFIGEAIWGYGSNIFWMMHAARLAGHPVKQLISFRGLEPQTEDYDCWGRWLQESWAKPDPASWTALSVVVDPDSLPELTTKALKQMTTFWTSFMQEPDSIRTTARKAHLREVPLFSSSMIVTLMVDMPAMAAKYPSVAADLKKAGLTAQQHEAYRIALLRDRLQNQSDLVRDNTDEYLALWTTGMWHTP